MRKLGFFKKRNSFSFSPASLQGLIAPLITPMNSDKSIDSFALKTITARLMNKGVKNFFVLSQFSEYTHLSPEQKKELMGIVSSEVSGKGFLIAGCFGSDTEEVVQNVIEAQRFTNICAVNVPAMCMERELEFIDFFDSIFTRTTTNILLYNNPFMSKKSIPPLWLDNIINWERLIGVIDYSRNPDYLDELGKYYQLTKLFEENEELAFDALRRGFSGLSCISTITFASYYLSLIEDFSELDYARVMRMEAKVSALNKLIPHNKKVQVVKHILALQGLIQPYYSDSLEALTQKEMQLIENAFKLRPAIVNHQ